MSGFHWNPIRQISDGRSHTDYSTGPVTFIPRIYVRQRKHWLYNNLLILLAGLCALTVSHEIDISNTDTRVRHKKVLISSSLCLSHFVAVPLIIWKMRLHNSIILGAMGMGIMPFFYYIEDPTLLYFVICLRIVFEALFTVSATIYGVKLARICSSVQGNALFKELLLIRSLTKIFNCAAKVASLAWQQYTKYPRLPENDRQCGVHFCQYVSSRKARQMSNLSNGQNTMFVAVSIVITLSGIILIAMYLKPITSLDDLKFSREPRSSGPMQVLKLFKKPKSVYLALLITTCVYMYGMVDEFVSAYVTCHYSAQYAHFIVATKQVTLMFGVLTCATLIDLTGCRWLYATALCGQLFCYACLLSWTPTYFNTEILFLVIYHVLCTSTGIEISILQLLVIQTLIDEEVSAWCFFYLFGDIAHLVRVVADMYLCTSAKLWIFIMSSAIAMMANIGYWYKIDENATALTLYGSCSLLMKTLKDTLAKPCTFDLKIVVEGPKDIRKVETFLQRDYTLKSRYLVPPPDDVFSDT